jgi:hypothetical protein
MARTRHFSFSSPNDPTPNSDALLITHPLRRTNLKRLWLILTLKWATNKMSRVRLAIIRLTCQRSQVPHPLRQTNERTETGAYSSTYFGTEGVVATVQARARKWETNRKRKQQRRYTPALPFPYCRKLTPTRLFKSMLAAPKQSWLDKDYISTNTWYGGAY